MLGTFKVRMLLAIFIVVITGLAMQSENSSRHIVEPAIRYILTEDYGVEQKISGFIEDIRRDQAGPLTPSSGNIGLQVPCEFLSIEKSYGWYWNDKEEKQEFSPLIRLKVHEKSQVRPVYDGEVSQILEGKDGYSVLLRHEGEFYSSYGALHEVLVERGEKVDKSSILGKTGQYLLFETKDKDGPINPNFIFE